MSSNMLQQSSISSSSLKISITLLQDDGGACACSLTTVETTYVSACPDRVLDFVVVVVVVVVVEVEEEEEEEEEDDDDDDDDDDDEKEAEFVPVSG